MPNAKKQTNSRKARKGMKTVPRPLPALPRSLVVRLPYTIQQTLTEGTAGVGTSYVYRLNSLFDPNETGVGTQPVGYDQWSNFFNRSVVFKADVDVTFVNSGTTSATFGITPLIGSAGFPTTAAAWPAQYGSKYQMLATTGRNVYRVRQTYDIARITGVSLARIMSEQDYSEEPAGPAVAGDKAAHLYIWIRGFTAVAVASIQVKIVFTAKFFQPKNLDLS